jgi:predicted flap endonuclease-1-like 5' DNA nuclease
LGHYLEKHRNTINMATTVKAGKKQKLNLKTVKNKYSEIHDNLLETSEDTINTTVKNVEKWQKLIAKSIKRSTPLVEKNMDMTFDAVETLAKQYKTGGLRVKRLLGLGGKDYKTSAPKATVTSKVTSIAKKTVPTKKAVVAKAKTATSKVVKKATTTASSVEMKLTAVNGIGPKIEGLLREKNINTISDLAKANIDVLNSVLDAAGPRFQMHDPSTWIKQAQELTK